MASDPTVFTPYSTVLPLFLEEPLWVPELERERIGSYEVYDKLYWNAPQAFKLNMRGTNDQPVYIPNARTVVNETAHYLLKGLTIAPEDGDLKSEFGLALTAFLKRERFIAKFHTAKWSGVTRGDWVLHLTADPDKPEGRRISINSLDPAQYFPIYDEDDIDRIIGVDLVDQYVADDGKTRIKRLRYTYVEVAGSRRVQREEVLLELEGWWDGKAARVYQKILPPELLPTPIETIPVYHFKNIDWQGQPFGSSELRGFEALLGSINQTISDEELALALEGLGVYATDAPAPTNDDGDDEPWMIAPGVVLETPTGTKFGRVPGVGSVTPMQDHLEFLTDSLYEGSSTFRTSKVDVALAESGVALAIRFSPTLAKLEQRDLEGVSVLEQMWFDWKFFYKAYEGNDYLDQEFAITLGDKLPINRAKRVEELNNMLDRQVIDRAYYRAEMKKLGYDFPDDMEKRVLEEQEKITKARMFESPVNGDDPTKSTNRSNNRGRVNESNGTEVESDR